MKFKYSTCKDISSFEASVSEVVDLLIPESGVDVRINDRIDYLVEWAFGFSGSENELFNHLLDRFSGAIESVDLKSAYRLKALQFFHSSGDQSLLDELSALEDRVIPILKVGVGVITYNRIDHMIENVTRIQKYSSCNPFILVSDDGSSDGTKEWCASHSVACMSGVNTGVVRNKNRALYHLSEVEQCDVVILIEDDCWPDAESWDKSWALSSLVWGHINYAHRRIIKNQENIVCGDGSVYLPYVAKLVTGQCTGVSADALRKVGYLNPVFKGYGVGHVEWTERFVRFGYNGLPGRNEHVFACISTGLVSKDATTHRDLNQVEKNREIKRTLGATRSYVEPWSDPADMRSFLSEVQLV